MNRDDHPENDQPSEPGDGADPSNAKSQEVRHNQVSAIVPEPVARGVFSTGAVVLQGQYEFILDFLLRMASPQQVACRVILPPMVVPRLIAALNENIEKYNARYGEITIPAPINAPQQDKPQQQSSAQELYEQLKLQDDVVSGTYSNAVMIGHTGTEFSLDFITTFFPRSAVAARVFLSAPNVPRLLESLKHAYSQYQRRSALASDSEEQPEDTDDRPSDWSSEEE